MLVWSIHTFIGLGIVDTTVHPRKRETLRTSTVFGVCEEIEPRSNAPGSVLPPGLRVNNNFLWHSWDIKNTGTTHLYDMIPRVDKI